MKIHADTMIVAFVCFSCVTGHAADNDWFVALQDARAKQTPVHVQWMVSRHLEADPEMAKALAASYEQKIDAARKAGDIAQADSVKMMADQILAEVGKEKHITFSVDAHYINPRRFLIEQVFNPATHPIKITYRCHGEAVYCEHDDFRTVEIKAHPDDFLEELLRGLPAFALPNRYLEELKHTHPMVKNDGVTVSMVAPSFVGMAYEVIYNVASSQLISASVRRGTSPVLEITGPAAGDPTATLYFNQLNGGKPQIQEEWHLGAEAAITDPASVNTAFHHVPGQVMTDMTGVKPVVLSNEEIAHAKYQDSE